MVEFEQDEINDPRAFEGFLRDQGFSRSRAKAITAKGFGGYSREQVEFAGLAKALEERRARLPLEEKARARVTMSLNGHWSSWERFQTVTVPDGGKIRIRATSANSYVRGLAGPFELEVRFTAPGGRRTKETWLSNGGLAGNGPYRAEAGMQEVQIRGRAPSIPQRVVVWLDVVR